MTDTLLSFDDVAGEVRPGPRPRGARRAQHRVQDVLRLPDGVRRRAEHPGLPDLPRPARRDAGGQRKAAVESAIRIGLALNCEIAEWCRFARKNYFYPDMPKNFQTSQYDEPIAFEGYLDVDVDGETFRVEIERAHMEEDTGKSLHVGGATGRIHGADYSLVDYNRAGIPLIEIVTKPIMGARDKAPEIAKAYVAQLRELIVALGVSDARMDQGSIRADVNLSLAPTGDGVLGTRTETKNVNSLRSVERAVRYEMQRHAAILDDGGSILQETRHWHEDTGITTSGREKSDAEDYRYFPEPDLVPVAPSPRVGRASCAARCPSRRRERRSRLQAEWGFSDLEMRDTVGAGALGLVEETIAAGATPQAARKWWLGELARRANDTDTDIAAARRQPDRRRRGPGARRRRHHQRQAGPPGLRRPVRRRGHARGDRRGPRAGDRLRRRRPRCRGGQRDRGQPRRRGQDPRRQGRGRRRADRRGDEGDARPGRRRPGPRADPREAHLSAAARLTPLRPGATTTYSRPRAGEAGPSPALTRNRRPPSWRRAGAPHVTRPDHTLSRKAAGDLPAYAVVGLPLSQREGTHAAHPAPRHRRRGPAHHHHPGSGRPGPGGAGAGSGRPGRRQHRRRLARRPADRRPGPQRPVRLRRLRPHHRRRPRPRRASAARTPGVGHGRRRGRRPRRELHHRRRLRLRRRVRRRHRQGPAPAPTSRAGPDRVRRHRPGQPGSRG